MAWQVSGTYFENCSCEVLCPCNATSLMLPADGDRCRALVAFHLEEGQADEVDLAGLNVAIFIDGPAQMTDGGWNLGLIVDERADDRQVDKLGGIFSGQVGGPLEPLVPLVGKVLGVERLPIEIVEDGLSHRLRIGDGTDVEVQDFHPEGQPEPTKIANVNIPFNTTLTVAQARRSRINLFGYELNHDGKSGASAPFAWSA